MKELFNYNTILMIMIMIMIQIPRLFSTFCFSLLSQTKHKPTLHPQYGCFPCQHRDIYI